jgi:thiamine kinase-like enzyme
LEVLCARQNETAALKYVLERLEDSFPLDKISYQRLKSSTANIYKINFGSSDTSKKIIVKIYKKNKNLDTDVSSSKNDYNFLNQLSKYCFNISDLLIPRVIMHLPEINCIVMESEDGLSLKEHILLNSRSSSKKEWNKIEVYYMKVGRVIGLIQTRTYKQTSDNSTSYLIKKLERIKTQIKYLRIVPLQQYFRPALRYIEEVSVSRDLGIAWTHGDLNPGNILINNQDKVVLLDFAESRFDSPYYDISSFTVRTLIDYGYNPLRYSSYHLQRLNYNFLKGYSSSFPHKISDKIFNYYSILQLIQYNSLLYKSRIFSLVSPRDLYALLVLRNACKYYMK